MSHTIGLEGFTLAILTFGALPQLPIGSYEQQPQTMIDRVDLMSSARREYEAIVSQLRSRRVLASAPSNAFVLEVSPGDEVHDFQEKMARTGRINPCIVMKDYLWRTTKIAENTFYTAWC